MISQLHAALSCADVFKLTLALLQGRVEVCVLTAKAGTNCVDHFRFIVRLLNQREIISATFRAFIVAIALEAVLKRI
jgi:hypothetical protein